MFTHDDCRFCKEERAAAAVLRRHRLDIYSLVIDSVLLGFLLGTLLVGNKDAK